MSKQPNQPHPGAGEKPSTSKIAAPETPKNKKGDVSEVNTTPSSRIFGGGTPEAAKRRVDKATAELAGSRCLLENTDERNIVQYAHCFPRSPGPKDVTANNLLLNLEYSWGIQARTLNLDTRSNIFRLSAKIHGLFDKGLWILLPEERIVKKYLESLPDPKKVSKPKTLPEIGPPPYKYTLVAHRDMGSVPLVRQNDHSIIKETNKNRHNPLTQQDCNLFYFPFSGVTIISHVQPRFVIAEVGYAMTCYTSPDSLPIRSGYPQPVVPVIATLEAIYMSWSTSYTKDYLKGLEDAIQFESIGPPRAAKLVDNDSKKTAPMRVGATSNKRQRGDEENNEPFTSNMTHEQEVPGNF